MSAPTAARLGLLACPVCEQVSRAPAPGAAGGCPRCGARVHSRKPASVSRTWALLIAAAILYVPANVEPVMITTSIFGTQADTILSSIAFQSRSDGAAAEPAKEGAVFQLFPRREAALAYEDVSVVPLQLRFQESVRGLTVGAPVDFRGITLGEVTGIRAAWDDQDRQIFVVVLIDVCPERLQRKEMRAEKTRERKSLQDGMDLLVKSGFRAQLKTGNLITGQLYVALDFHRDAKAAAMDWKADPPELPTIPGSLIGVEQNVAAITSSLAKVRFDEIGADLQRTLASLDRTLKSFDQAARRVDEEVTPEVKQAIVGLRGSLAAVERTIAADAPLQQDLRETLREVSRAAASLRVLTEYLEQHPEALIRGKPEEKP